MTGPTDDRGLSAVSDHYGQADLVGAIERGFAEMGHSIDDLTIAELAAVDEFHTGGRAATKAVMAGLGLAEGAAEGTTVLDVGCGLGGAARYCAAELGCRVTGIDLTPSYIDAATALTGWVGLEDRATFRCVSAQDMALERHGFDAAYLLHVGMNVADKTELFTAIAGGLKPGSRLAVYDLMRTETGELTFPLPWATTPTTSSVATQAAYETSLADAGYELVAVRDRTELATAFLEQIQAQRASTTGPPPVGLHLLMGDDIGAKVANLVAALQAGVLSPIEIIATLPD